MVVVDLTTDVDGHDSYKARVYDDYHFRPYRT